MQIKTTCRIKYDEKRDCCAVAIGVRLVHFGTLFSCEEWARNNNVPVANQDEVNRFKFGNMPVEEVSPT